jgi:pimeloyl-ACP methyl ester carboxylesterase
MRLGFRTGPTPRAVEGLAVTEHGTGKPVLLLHGQPGSSVDFHKVVTAFGGSLRTLSIDRPGWGQTGGKACSFAAQAELVAEELLGRDTGPVVVVGYSFGGGIALRLALDHPELVAGLVLVSSIGGKGSVTFGDLVLGAPLVGPALSLITLAGLATAVPFVVRHAGVASLKANLPDQISRLSVAEVQAFIDEQRFLLRDHETLERSVSQLRVPARVLHGELDIVVAPEAGHALATALGVELEVLKGVGHLVVDQDPNAIAEAVRSLSSRSLL